MERRDYDTVTKRSAARTPLRIVGAVREVLVASRDDAAIIKHIAAHLTGRSIRQQRAIVRFMPSSLRIGQKVYRARAQAGLMCSIRSNASMIQPGATRPRVTSAPSTSNAKLGWPDLAYLGVHQTDSRPTGLGSPLTAPADSRCEIEGRGLSGGHRLGGEGSKARDQLRGIEIRQWLECPFSSSIGHHSSKSALVGRVDVDLSFFGWRERDAPTVRPFDRESRALHDGSMATRFTAMPTSRRRPDAGGDGFPARTGIRRRRWGGRCPRWRPAAPKPLVGRLARPGPVGAWRYDDSDRSIW
jgi:hypothetical protein